MFITSVISGQKLGQLEKLMEKNYGRNGNSSIPAISISSLEYATTYKNGKLGIKVSVRIDRSKISPEEFGEVRQIISPKNKPDLKSTQTPHEYSGSGC
ncbi:MAG: hypothetical protein WCJ57_03220 [Candidatus Falkowbacteria bacterium]